MKATLHDRLQHMLDALDALDELSQRNRPLGRIERAAFERFFEIISEVSRLIPEDMRADYAQIPWRGIADLGNELRHGYEAIDLERLAKIARQDMTDLRTAIIAIRAKVNRPEPF